MSYADGGTFLAGAQESTKETPVPLIYPPDSYRPKNLIQTSCSRIRSPKRLR